MAQYEIKAVGAKKPTHTEHDKDKAITWADTQTKESGVVFDVYEIKHIHLTSKMETEDFAFF